MNSIRTPEQQQRYDFFLHLAGWGTVRSKDLRLGIICIEDGGEEWLQNTDPDTQKLVERTDEETDEIIHLCRGNSDEVDGFRFIHRNQSASTAKGTEQTQIRTAWTLRKARDPEFNMSLDEYRHKFQHGHEVVGNLFPFAKRTAGSDLSPRMKDYVGYPHQTTLQEIRQEVLPQRLLALAALSTILAKKDGGLLLLMGLWDHEEQIVGQILGKYRRWDAGDDALYLHGYDGKPYKKRRKIHCWRRTDTTPTLAFVDNATHGFQQPVCDSLVRFLRIVGWPM